MAADLVSVSRFESPKFFQLCHLKNAVSNSSPAHLPFSIRVQHNAGHTSHNQVQPQERSWYVCRMSVPGDFLFSHFLVIWLQSSPARMRNLVLHLQTHCLCLQPHQRRHKRQEILWEEFYTKAIYRAKCSLIADNCDLGQCCMAVFERGDTCVSSVLHCDRLPGNFQLPEIDTVRQFSEDKNSSPGNDCSVA